MKTILITGGAGFVGSNLALHLKQHYDNVRIIAQDNLIRRGSELNLPRLKENGIEFVKGDIRNPEDIASVGAFDTLLECSAEPSVLAGYGSSPRYVIDTNLGGTVNCLEAAREHNAEFLFLSTSRVYPIKPLNNLTWREDTTRFAWEDTQPLPGASSQGITEAFPLEGTRSMYGATKLASELIMQEYLEMYDMRGIINRCGVITGPWQMGKVDQGVVVLWAARHIYGGALSYIGYGGTGKQVRDFVHIDDLARLVTYQLDHIGELSGQTFNVGGGLDVSVSLQELTTICQGLTGNTIHIASEMEDRPADLRLYITDNTRITQATGWAPEKTVETTLEDIVKWIRDNQEQLQPILT
ncbi:MAG: 3-beta hydroxysteroid dehydrogenase [Candidatus Hydrogenedentota bacterium]|nr:MAG: 3-beta hydroxysteroid dehydrogenase [Candidatus Hydrogenedentota bacterium]